MYSSNCQKEKAIKVNEKTPPVLSAQTGGVFVCAAFCVFESLTDRLNIGAHHRFVILINPKKMLQYKKSKRMKVHKREIVFSFIRCHAGI